MKTIIFFILLLSINLFSKNIVKNIVIFKVIPNFKLSDSQKESINSAIESNLTSYGYGIINEKIQNEALNEQKKQYNSDCYDETCLVDTGRMLAAQKLIIVKVFKQNNNKYLIKSRLIDIESGIIENSYTTQENIDLDNYNEINKTLKKLISGIIKNNTSIGKSLDSEKKKKIKIEHKKANNKKYLLKINTSVDYTVSYYLMNSDNYVIKYFKHKTKSAYLPQGVYKITLTHKDYKTENRIVKLEKDTTIYVTPQEKEILSAIGLEPLSEIKVISSKEYFFHSGIIVDIIDYRMKSLKIDFLRFGFLTDFKNENSLTEIKLSFMNIEFYLSKNIFLSLALSYFMGDSSFMYTSDKEDNDLYIMPIGIKTGYIKRLYKNLNLKIYARGDWMLDMSFQKTPKSHFLLTAGIGLEYFIN